LGLSGARGRWRATYTREHLIVMLQILGKGTKKRTITKNPAANPEVVYKFA